MIPLGFTVLIVAATVMAASFFSRTRGNSLPPDVETELGLFHATGRPPRQIVWQRVGVPLEDGESLIVTVLDRDGKPDPDQIRFAAKILPRLRHFEAAAKRAKAHLATSGYRAEGLVVGSVSERRFTLHLYSEEEDTSCMTEFTGEEPTSFAFMD